MNRKRLVAKLFELSQTFYVRNFKKHKTAWGLCRKELLDFPSESVGYHLGSFLQQNGYELIDKVERHDAYHVLTGFGTHAEDEVALQYLCFGNGKRSPYLFGVILVGTCILPEYLHYYYRSYKLGRASNPFHAFDYKKLLHVSLRELRMAVFSDSIQQQLANLVGTTQLLTF